MAEYDAWHAWGKGVLHAEMVLAILLTVVAIYLAFTGPAGVLT